jgi:hypothetical protein
VARLDGRFVPSRPVRPFNVIGLKDSRAALERLERDVGAAAARLASDGR